MTTQVPPPAPGSDVADADAMVELDGSLRILVLPLVARVTTEPMAQPREGSYFLPGRQLQGEATRLSMDAGWGAPVLLAQTYRTLA
ncbi:hypothetical protein [Cellulomonas timonensis]|uniref:hypothetical protein n=1 Tax=Cellulomonas timonensis TaxID=1689271 RepID=UPI000A6AC292|nr:hypothetical protein [Cellulomonas timonensis]